MTTEVTTVAARAVPVSLPTPERTSADERWAAWEAKGIAQDRAFSRKVAIVAPILIIVAAIIVYVFLGR